MDWEKRLYDSTRLKNRTDTTKELKKYFDRGYRYVVRDLDGEWLVLFALKPKKYMDLEIWGYDNEFAHEAIPCKLIRNVDIAEINWKNRSAVLIEDFLKNNETTGSGGINVSELLDAAIEEIGRVLIGNKDRNTEEVYLKNAIRHIREYGSQPQLNENQQVVLDWLKNRYTGDADPFGVAACLFSQMPQTEVIVATLKLTRDEQAQVLKIFANWTLEQEVDCAYCKRGAPLNETANSNFVIYIDREDDEYSLAAGYDDDYTIDNVWCDINFCPVCGGKLAEDIDG